MKIREIASLALICIVALGMSPVFALNVSTFIPTTTTVSVFANPPSTSTYAGWGVKTVTTIPQSNLCIFTPMDSHMDPQILPTIQNEVQYHGISFTTISVKDQLSKNYNCAHIIKIDRGINNNYRFTDKTTKFTVYKHTGIIFTYKVELAVAPNDAGPLVPMTNINCELQAHQQKYFSGVGQLPNTPTCDPYAGSMSENPTLGELSYNVIQASVDSVLKAFNLM